MYFIYLILSINLIMMKIMLNRLTKFLREFVSFYTIIYSPMLFSHLKIDLKTYKILDIIINILLVLMVILFIFISVNWGLSSELFHNVTIIFIIINVSIDIFILNLFINLKSVEEWVKTDLDKWKETKEKRKNIFSLF